MNGKIHSLVSFSTVDGPGIRYVVFMQGCNLRCKFCHNPDTWATNGKMELSSDELVEKISNAKLYFGKDGGVTFSGGEPLMQADFLVEVCSKLKELSIHVTIDTAGNFDIDNPKINRLLEYVDLMLFDIKHINSNIHKEIVGVDNEKILKFARYVSNIKHIPLWIRIVYIPSITDRQNSIEEYRQYISTLKNVKKVDVLPYHEMGKYKWKELGISYKLEGIRIPTKDECRAIEKVLYN